jgi:hypothetical protein
MQCGRSRSIFSCNLIGSPQRLPKQVYWSHPPSFDVPLQLPRPLNLLRSSIVQSTRLGQATPHRAGSAASDRYCGDDRRSRIRLFRSYRSGLRQRSVSPMKKRCEPAAFLRNEPNRLLTERTRRSTVERVVKRACERARVEFIGTVADLVSGFESRRSRSGENLLRRFCETKPSRSAR